MSETVSENLDVLLPLAMSWGLKLVGAVLVLLVGRWVAGRIRGGVRRGLERREVDASLIPFVAGLSYYLVLAVVIIAVLGLFGIETTSLIAILGAAGLAVGLALQGTLSNFAAGVMLLLFRPFRVGQYVECAGTAGSVREIGIFTTELATPDNVQITVPNAAIWGQTIKNYSANDNRRNDLVVGVSYGDDLGAALDVVRKVVEADPRVLSDPETQIAVAELGDSSVNLVVRPWCHRDDYWALRFDLVRRIKESLEAAGCSIPFPQRDVHVIPADGANGAGAAAADR